MKVKRHLITFVLSAAVGMAFYGSQSSGQSGSASGDPRNAASSDLLKSGAYKVCDVGNHDAHGATVGRHLELGDSVTIGALDLATDVQLGRQVLSMIQIGDGEELRATYDFAHAENTSRRNTNVTHLVRIRRDNAYRPSPMSACKGTGDVLIIQFCPKVTDAAGNLRWECNPANAHLGDVHVEN